MVFKFHSHQVHHVQANGHRRTRRNIVRVNGSKGTKIIETHDSKHGKTRRAKALTRKEIKNIKSGVFMPKLFKHM